MNSYARSYPVFQISLWLLARLTSSLFVNVPEVLLPSFDVTKSTNIYRLLVAPDVRSLQTVVTNHAFLETDFSLEGNSLLPANCHKLNDDWLICIYNIEKDCFVPNWTWTLLGFRFLHRVVLENLDPVRFVVLQIDSVYNVDFKF